MKISSFSIGADPEFILTKDGKVVSAIGLVPGSKNNPVVLPNGAGLQTDNVAVEFASPVAHSFMEFIDSIKVSLGLIHNGLPKGYGLVSKPSAIFPDSELKHPQAVEFGCEPDWNCWTGSMNPKPNAENKNLRSFGGHVHIGCSSKDSCQFLLDEEGKVLTVKMCDIFLGVPSVLLDNSDEAKARRHLYGKAGSYRPKKYGVEYRVLSNFWTGSELLMSWVYHTVSDVLNFIENGEPNKLLEEVSDSIVQHVINGSALDSAERIHNHIVQFLSDTTNNLMLEALTMKNYKG